jgi:hypothetical protein
MGGGGRVTWRSQPIVYTQYRVRLILLPVTPLLRFFLLFFFFFAWGFFPQVSSHIHNRKRIHLFLFCLVVEFHV